MQSFRTELELVTHAGKVLVEKDIIDLDRKIRQFRDGALHEEKFRSLRLARGVYGQRQKGVQMIRIKLPFGRISTKQLLKIAAISDEYSNGNLHLTTRQDIQIHHVSLDRTPELWAKLEQDEITLREACGNTVRNITASAEAGVDPDEPFDVSPYAYALFQYLLRKPFGQELGRKIKIAFSNSEKDSAFTYIHDIGLIPKIDSSGNRGFKVLVGGGLGAQPFLAQVAHEFLPENRLIPFVEATVRVFDRYGERVSRHKARIKYLIHKIGVTGFLELVNEEEGALLQRTYAIDLPVLVPQPNPEPFLALDLSGDASYAAWLATNTFPQKQQGYYGVYVKIPLGNISSSKARGLALLIERFAAPADTRITINQGFLLRFVGEAALPHVFKQLQALQLAAPGFDSVADITACPGTDTCNLAISNSTQISLELERLIYEEFPELIYERDIRVKISGCMNSCGQHGLAQIGFHGSSFKVGNSVVPAIQVLLGGGSLGDGKGKLAEKIIKVASKRAPDVLRRIFNDLEDHAGAEESFNDYYERKGKDYFYQLLKPLADNSTLAPAEYVDWGSEELFQTAIGTGECASVVIDLVATLFFESEEKLGWAAEALSEGRYGDSIYYSYAAFISAAKALLLDRQLHVNTHHQLISDFETHFVESGLFELPLGFKALVLQIKERHPDQQFAAAYFDQASDFFGQALRFRDHHELEKPTVQ